MRLSSSRASGNRRLLPYLFAVNGVACCAASLVLALAPSRIPSLVGITIQPRQFLLAHLLAAAELAIAALCLSATMSRDDAAIRLSVIALTTFHLASGLAGLAASIRAPNAMIEINVALRVLMAGALAWLAYRELAVTHDRQ